MDKLPQRKDIRLKDYDYSQAGYYFITICTKDKKKLLSEIISYNSHDMPKSELTLIGNEIFNTINFMDKQYSGIKFDKYIIMPNHIHLIIILHGSQLASQENPQLHKIIGQLKSYTTKRYNDLNNTKNLVLWQRNYYEHIIRNEQEYKKIWQYIETNPLKWEEDKYYI